MTDLTDRMRTCAAHLASVGIGASTQAIDDAADLLIEASNALERVVVAEVAGVPIPMEIIPPVTTKSTEKYSENYSAGTWTAPGDTLPVANPYRSVGACPQCDSRANKRVCRDGNRLMLICPVCAHTWPYTKKPPAGGPTGGKD